MFELSFLDDDFQLEVDGCQYVELSACSQNTQHCVIARKNESHPDKSNEEERSPSCAYNDYLFLCDKEMLTSFTVWSDSIHHKYKFTYI